MTERGRTRTLELEVVRDSRERQISRLYPDLIKEVRLSDPLSAQARQEGWAPASLLAEALLRDRFRQRPPAEKAALTVLSQSVIMTLQDSETTLFLARLLERRGVLNPPFRRVPTLTAAIVEAARQTDLAALAQLLLDEIEAMKTEPLVSPSARYSRLHGEAVRVAYDLVGGKEGHEQLLLRGILGQTLRARHVLEGESVSRPTYLVGGDDRGYVHHELRKVPENEQGLWRLRAAEHLMEMMPDARELDGDLPRHPDEFFALTPDFLERFTRQLRLDKQLLEYFEQEIASRQHYQISQPTEIVIEYAGVEKICFYPAKSFLARLPYEMLEQVQRLRQLQLQLPPSERTADVFPAVYHPVSLFLEGGVAFGALIITHGVGSERTQFESSLSTAAKLLGDNDFMATALRCLTLACYRDLVVPDVRDEHYVRAENKQTKKERKREQAGSGERLRFLPRVVYEQRLTAERRAQGLPLEPRWVTPFIRRLPATWQASERALAKASEFALQVPEGWTFVSPHVRPKPKDGEQPPAPPRRQYRSWSAYDLLARSE